MSALVTSIRKRLRPVRRTHSEAIRTFQLWRGRRILCAREDLSPAQLEEFALETPLVEEEKRLVQRVSLKVSSLDLMFLPSDSTSYLTAGVSAVRSVKASLAAAGKNMAGGTVLDFPCGYGRVLRFLKEAFPDARIVGAEVDAAMVEFCRSVFAVEGHLSSPVESFKSLSLPWKFDLIWCGSLITHFDDRATVALLEFFCRHLVDGGVCVFTTHGEHVAELFRSGRQTFHLHQEGLKKVLREYQQQGYGYSDYPWATPDRSPGRCGISLSSRSRVAEIAQSAGPWQEIYFEAKGWHKLQDVHAFRRHARTPSDR